MGDPEGYSLYQRHKVSTVQKGSSIIGKLRGGCPLEARADSARCDDWNWPHRAASKIGNQIRGQLVVCHAQKQVDKITIVSSKIRAAAGWFDPHRTTEVGNRTQPSQEW